NDVVVSGFSFSKRCAVHQAQGKFEKLSVRWFSLHFNQAFETFLPAEHCPDDLLFPIANGLELTRCVEAEWKAGLGRGANIERHGRRIELPLHRFLASAK